MDDLDFTISASGKFGNFMWEYPDEAKKLFQELREEGGEDVVRGIMEAHKDTILGLLYINLGILYAGGPLVPILGEYVPKCLGKIAEECIKVIRSSH